MTTEAETGVMLPQAQEQGLLTTPEAGRGTGWFSIRTSRRNCAADTLILDLWPPELKEFLLEAAQWMPVI